MGAFLLRLSDDRASFVRDLSREAGVSQSALLRRLIDHARTGDTVNVLYPHISGRAQVGARED